MDWTRNRKNTPTRSFNHPSNRSLFKLLIFIVITLIFHYEPFGMSLHAEVADDSFRSIQRLSPIPELIVL